VARRLEADGRELKLVKDQVVFEGREVLGASGEPHRVYTPYMKAWLARLRAEDVAPREPRFEQLWPSDKLTGDDLRAWPLEAMGFRSGELWLKPGESGARERLDAFSDAIDDYHDRRDFLTAGETSGLSVHLRFGTVSVREAVRYAQAKQGPGPHKWLLELVWREFYQMILANFPDVETQEFNPAYRGLNWPGDDEALAAWQEGRTGYPIVDAGMRCLKATGWMHNRMRMVVASFLTKDLLVDWRRGEAWFARQLLDFDLASNNGGWQWAASTGVDAQPYFRIFNPINQARKFDPEGSFIREWVPELGPLGSGAIWPLDLGPLELEAAGVRLGETYPRPITDHAAARERAIEFLGRR
jgi:deoxyribodipyrimidine photo-lyase